MREPFAQRAQEMGLNVDGNYKGLFSYADQYSEVVYRQLGTNPGLGISDSYPHETDGLETPIIAIYTRPTSDVDFQYVGYVSNIYQFIGNEVLCQRVRRSITEVGMPIVTERYDMTWDNTRFRNEIIIQSSQTHQQTGDILPVMIVNNSYNGTRAATLAFGIALSHGEDRLVFAFSLGEMRQVHIESSNTEMRSAIASYMQVFGQNITDMITHSFNSQLTEDDMLTFLDVIEGYGKKRRDEISTILQEIQGDRPLPSAWQVFLAVVRYSSFEKNLNMKRMLENAAESVLVIPPRMLSVLEQLQNT